VTQHSTPRRPLREVSPKQSLRGTITRIEPYGAYVDVGSDTEGLLHISRIRKDPVNRIEVIELRTDPKYGKFFQHTPARARVRLTRKGETVVVEITDFISPTIIERLHAQAGVLQPKIDDWRAMVDCVMIDTDYDGRVFRIALSDVPERKTDLVAGRYELPADRIGSTIAVKIIDMLGEEVLVALPVDPRKDR